MLGDDLKTVREILLAKKMVKARLRDSAAWCRPGLWFVEGGYARHREVTLPASLRGAIHGLVKRRIVRKFVERIMPPWWVIVRSTASIPPQRLCSIAYLSKAGDWKLFDLENHAVWTCARVPQKAGRDLENASRFGEFFHIPPSDTLQENGKIWRYDKYISSPKLAQCSAAMRGDIFRALVQQYVTFARAEAVPPDPALTQNAIAALGECAPGSIPARIANRYHAEMHHLGEVLKLLPAHGDLNAQNVFVSDGQPWIIDWDAAGRLQPLLYDLLSLIIWETDLGRFDLLEAFLQGRFDEDLKPMFEMCGLPMRPCDNLLMLVHGYMLRFRTLRTAKQRDAIASNVDRLWNSMRAYCKEYL